MNRLELSDKHLFPEDSTTLIVYQKPSYPAIAELFLVNNEAGVSFWFSVASLQEFRDWCDGLLKELDKIK